MNEAEVYSFSLPCSVTWRNTIYPFYSAKLYGSLTGFLTWQMVLPWTSWMVDPIGNCHLGLEGRCKSWLGSNSQSNNILGKITLIAIPCANIVGVKWYFIVSSICLFLIPNEVRHFSMFTDNVGFLFCKTPGCTFLVFFLIYFQEFFMYSGL